MHTMPDSELVLIVAAQKIEGLPEDVSIDKSIDCITGMYHHPSDHTHRREEKERLYSTISTPRITDFDFIRLSELTRINYRCMRWIR